MTISSARLDRLARAIAAQRASQTRSALGSLVVPPITDFVLSPEYLGLKRLYPRQATLLKVLFLETDNFTEYDNAVLDEWAAGFRLSTDASGNARFVGAQGTPPDLRERMQLLRDEDAPWFPEFIAVAGRRASKNWLGAVIVARVIYWYLARHDPHDFLDIESTKRLTIPIFAATKDQATGQQFADLKRLLKRARCFKPYIAKSTANNVLLWTPVQLEVGAPEDPEDALIEVVARQATESGARGPATPVVIFDEAAHMVAGGANRSLAQIAGVAVPAAAQFDGREFVYYASSPYRKDGGFYDAYEAALRTDETGRSLRPTSLVVQLPSWGLYEDWRLTHEGLVTRPGGDPFPRIRDPVLKRDSPLVRDAETNNPARFAVEYLAQFADAESPYLPSDYVRRMFLPYNGRALTQIDQGAIGIEYHAHVDLGRVEANTALVIAHAETVGADRHMVVDHIRIWRPDEFVDRRVNYAVLERELLSYLGRFPITQLTFDQYQSAGLIDRLNEATRNQPTHRQIDIYEVTATKTRNWEQAKFFLDALSWDLIHAFPHELAELELLSLTEVGYQRVDHPTTGPCTTSDVADCLFGLAHRLIDNSHVHERLGSTQSRGSFPGGFPLNPRDAEIFQALSGVARFVAQPRELRRRGPRC